MTLSMGSKSRKRATRRDRRKFGAGNVDIVFAFTDTEAAWGEQQMEHVRIKPEQPS